MKLLAENHYPISVWDAKIKKEITFRYVTFEKDFDRLHGWMNQEHVIPFWNLDKPRAEYASHLKHFLAKKHQQLLIGEIDGQPMSYWEAYMVSEDLIRHYYDYEKGDQGIHLLIGEKDYLGKGFIYPLMLRLMKRMFEVSETKRIMAEPDIRNEKMIHVFEKCGFQQLKTVELPDKTAMLLYCQQDVFESRWNAWIQGKF
ncbi:GNAT family N-acetyltransferase [Priestia sp. GS2]|uniref:GNAT family N-acetyltransferase n=1 Tax=Priestia sp. GS2 TaxID=3117403 RepID=UPI002EDAD4A8